MINFLKRTLRAYLFFGTETTRQTMVSMCILLAITSLMLVGLVLFGEDRHPIYLTICCVVSFAAMFRNGLLLFPDTERLKYATIMNPDR